MIYNISITSHVVGKTGKLLGDPDRWPRFGRWLKREREDAGLTQDEVCGKTTLTQVHLSRIETGESGTKPETIYRLADAIGFDVREGLRKAGFSPADEQLNVPEMIENFTALPPSVQEDFALQINAVAEKYRAQKAGTKPRPRALREPARAGAELKEVTAEVGTSQPVKGGSKTRR